MSDLPWKRDDLDRGDARQTTASHERDDRSSDDRDTEPGWRDDRARGSGRPALTERERQERWPLG